MQKMPGPRHERHVQGKLFGVLTSCKVCHVGDCPYATEFNKCQVLGKKTVSSLVIE